MEIKSIQFNDNTWFTPTGKERLIVISREKVVPPDVEDFPIRGIWLVIDAVIYGMFNMDSIKYVKFKKQEEI